MCSGSAPSSKNSILISTWFSFFGWSTGMKVWWEQNAQFFICRVTVTPRSSPSDTSAGYSRTAGSPTWVDEFNALDCECLTLLQYERVVSWPSLVRHIWLQTSRWQKAKMVALSCQKFDFINQVRVTTSIVYIQSMSQKERWARATPRRLSICVSTPPLPLLRI